MEKTSADQKLKLIQSIRAENQYNRMKCREREKLLYGAETGHKNGYDMVLNGYRNMEEAGMSSAEETSLSEKRFFSGFRFRFVLTICLLAGFIYMDQQKITIHGESLRSCCEKLTEEDAVFKRIFQSLNLFDF